MNKINAVLTVENISKRLGHKQILSNVSFSLYPREIVGLIGSNGAGKTTLLYILLGLINPDMGVARVFSSYDTSIRSDFLRYINFASSAHRLNGYANVMENLLTFARLYDVPNPLQRIIKLAEDFEIKHLLYSKIKVYSLSAGENNKVNLCKAFLNNPKILFFDEISSHLDSISKKKVLTYFKEYCKKRNATILYITHNLKEASLLCDRNIVIKKGKITNIVGKSSLKTLETLL